MFGSVNPGRVASRVRPHLIDPVPLSEVLDEYINELDDEQERKAS